MKYRAVISDLDGTLLNSNHQVSEYTKKVIKKVLSRGVHFFIATGRHHVDVNHIRKQLGLDTVFITSNGCRVHNPNKETVLAYDLSEDIVKQLLAIEIDPNIHVNIYQDDQWFVEKENKWINQFHNDSGFFYEIVDFETLEKYTASKLFFICDDHEKLVELQHKIENIFPGRLNLSFSLPTCLEIMPHGISKGFAIKKVLEKYRVHPKESVAFGDGLNDLEMLQIVGKGFIMGNAHDKLKAALPNNPIIETNDEDAVANTLEKLFLE
ncbi:MAG: hypothetical protein PWQ37_441 [Candidatus Petromonas sp.]|jgi:Cof subfamily protein (haloacid dehalogenase superfamily)|nr:hypothetical protein [Candidatus Petromonas sp.]